jgi:hypothetical protein
MFRSATRRRPPSAARRFLRGTALGAAIGAAEFFLQHRSNSAAVAFAVFCLTMFFAECG